MEKVKMDGDCITDEELQRVACEYSKAVSHRLPAAQPIPQDMARRMFHLYEDYFPRLLVEVMSKRGLPSGVVELK